MSVSRKDRPGKLASLMAISYASKKLPELVLEPAINSEAIHLLFAI